MIKRMLIDDTQPEETRVVVINGNKLEDVEYETRYRRQIKGNIYLGKVMRVEPSLQACFVDYGGNKHGFMAFGEIHPDYYNIPQEELDALDKEVDEIIERKKQALKDREAERERIRQEKAAAREEALRRREEKAREEAAAKAAAETQEQNAEDTAVPAEEKTGQAAASSNESPVENIPAESAAQEENTEENSDKKHAPKKRLLKKRHRKEQQVTEDVPAVTEDGRRAEEVSAETAEVTAEEKKTENKPAEKKTAGKKTTAEQAPSENVTADEKPLKVMSESIGTEEETVSEEVDQRRPAFEGGDDEIDDDDEDLEMDFELQRKLLRARKLFHRSKIQDVIKEGQILLVQVVKEERGNKGAALTTYLSLAGRYCVLMPNRIKSGGVSRKITNAADRTRLKNIVKELPLTADMSIIVRTAGEEKTKADIVRDYNYLIRAWNQIRLNSLRCKAPALIHEEGDLIKRALRDIYTKEVSEIIVAGDEAFKAAKEFFKILSPHSLKKIKAYRNNDMPLFQRFQVEGQLDKLHEANAQLESGGYLVINPTEALVSIDVNSGRATKEKDLEETALKTNLEACDEIARQLRMRNLAGLVVIDFIDMDEPANNHAVEKRMKEALKKDRSRIQVGKMSMFGLLELSRQRMHSSFMESNYQICPHCQGKGMVRTTESCAVYVLRGIEEEGIKGRSSRINVFVPADTAIYLLNQKRQTLINMEQKYKMEVIISADNSIQCISDYRIERTKSVKEDKAAAEADKTVSAAAESCFNDENAKEPETVDNIMAETVEATGSAEKNNSGNGVANNNGNADGSYRNNNRRRRDRGGRRRGRDRFERRNNNGTSNNGSENGAAAEAAPKPVQEAVILYNSHEDIKSKPDSAAEEKPVKEKSTWWKKLIKG